VSTSLRMVKYTSLTPAPESLHGNDRPADDQSENKAELRATFGSTCYMDAIVRIN